MKYASISNKLFTENRKRFIKNLLPSSVAVFNSNDIMPTNADGSMAFRQNNDLFYLSGIDQEESILVLAPDAYTKEYREVLFVRETNERIAIWEGAKLTKKEAAEVSGIKTVFWLSEFDRVFAILMADAKNVYLNTNEHLRATIEVETRDARFIKKCKEKFPLHHYERSAPLLMELRSIKSDTEIELIRQACAITKKGFLRTLKMVKPGVMEYEIEAELIHEFIRNRSRGFAYGPIIASGLNSCVLHYVDNNKECKAGDILLMDVAAEYANYASDLTRCLPVSGKFTDRQKQVYNAVLRVMKEATAMLRPGTILSEYNKEVGKIMEKELIDLGLLNQKEVRDQDKENPLYKKYFMHGTSHFLGLDVHDVGYFDKPIKAGMVFTCEPGIYIQEEKLGIRLENDILVTNGAPIDLMADIPLEAGEIEALMSESVKVLA